MRLVILSIIASLAIPTLAACAQTDKPHTTASASSSSATPPPVPAQAHTSTVHLTLENSYERGADDLLESHVVHGAEQARMTAVVREYYAAAAAEDGVAACKLLYSLFAEEIPEVYGSPPGAKWMSGKTCAAVMVKVFKSNHRELVEESAEFKVTLVRVKRLRGLALMKFGSRPELDIPMHLEHGRWKVDSLLATGMQ